MTCDLACSYTTDTITLIYPTVDDQTYIYGNKGTKVSYAMDTDNLQCESSNLSYTVSITSDPYGVDTSFITYDSESKIIQWE